MYDVILSYFLLFSMVAYIENTFIKLILTSLILLVAFKYYYLNKAYVISNNIKQPFIFKILMLIFFFGIIRNNLSGVSIYFSFGIIVNFISFILLTKEVYKYLYNKNLQSVDVFHRLIITPFGLYAGFNILAWLIGISSPQNSVDIGQCLILSKIGININRVNFPFANGINSYASTVGGLLTIEIAYIYFLKKKKNWKNYIFLIIFLVTLLLTDSRAAILYPLLLNFCIYFIIKREKIPFLKFVPFIIIIGPLLLFLVLPLVYKFQFFSDLSRSSNDIDSGNSRFIIWGISIVEFLLFKIQHIYGYGLYGHFATKSSLEWANLFKNYATSDAMHPHNSLLSILFDYGYLGLVCILIFFFQICKRVTLLWVRHKELCILFISFFLYLMAISITETYIGFYYSNSMNLIFFFLLIPFTIPLENENA